jgi:CheY-like chemotaxis protein
MTQPLRILLVASDDENAQLIRDVMAASTTPRFQVDYAPNGWEAQRQAPEGAYEALVVDYRLGDTDGETLLERLAAIGVRAPAVLLTPPGWDQVVGAAADYLPRTEGLNRTALVRAIVAMVQRHALRQELAAALDQAARATTELRELTHDLATPLGVVSGMTQALLADNIGLDADGRSCLEDVSREALRACAILKRFDQVQPPAGPTPAVLTPVPDMSLATRSGPSSKTVLIADDDPATRRMVSATLASDQYRVVQAADGKEAWQMIREHHPAVAILDWQMPVYSGLELTDVIKGDPQMRDMMVIMLTGRSAAADREAGARAHADLYLVKPFSPQELLGALRHALSLTEPAQGDA